MKRDRERRKDREIDKQRDKEKERVGHLQGTGSPQLLRYINGFTCFATPASSGAQYVGVPTMPEFVMNV